MALPNPLSQSQSQSQSPSPTSSRRSSSCNSPEFEFQFNPSFPSPTSLHSADQLFFRGLLLPLHLLPPSDPPPPPPIAPPVADSDPTRPPSLLSATASNRWSLLFKKSDKKPPDEDKPLKKKDKEKKRDRKGGASAANSAELNINLWPFTRSRSAGNNSGSGCRARSAFAARKASSAPCSRSNSAGESKSRRSWPISSPGRAAGGVHIGRSSPVWQLPRTHSGRAAEKGKKPVKGGAAAGASRGGGGRGGKGRVLSLNVPMCIGYRHHLSCRSGEASEVGGGGPRIVRNSGGNLFNLRSLFSKKVY